MLFQFGVVLKSAIVFLSQFCKINIPTFTIQKYFKEIIQIYLGNTKSHKYEEILYNLLIRYVIWL